MSTYPGLFMDGLSAGRHKISLRRDQDDIVILFDDEADTMRWPRQDIRALRDQAGADQVILRLEEESEARLVLEHEDAIRWVFQTCPNLDKHPQDTLGTRLVLKWTAGAIVSFLLLLFVIIPTLAEWLAPIVPKETQVALGAQIRGQAVTLFARGVPEKRYCVDPSGQRALQSMVDRLATDETLPFDLRLAVVDSKIVNTFAMPGGHIVVLSGLITDAETADEVAAVLAHEIGHIAARDPMRTAMRSAGSAGLLSLALGDFLGAGVLATISSQLIDARYSRAAETAADHYAADLLAQSGVPPDALARFFDRLSEAQGDGRSIPPYFASHPPLAERSATLRDSAMPKRARPILSDAEWAALRSVCDKRAAAPLG